MAQVLMRNCKVREKGERVDKVGQKVREMEKNWIKYEKNVSIFEMGLFFVDTKNGKMGLFFVDGGSIREPCGLGETLFLLGQASSLIVHKISVFIFYTLLLVYVTLHQSCSDSP